MGQDEQTAGERQYYFLHIPKTAGTSLRSIIESQFPDDALCPDNATIQEFGGNYPPIHRVLSIPQDEFDRARLVRGHYFYNMVSRFRCLPVRLTMLREPVARSVSFLRHALREFSVYKDTDINELLTDDRFVQKYIADFQVKLLGLELDNTDPSRVPVDVNVALTPGPRMLERAQQVLEQFEYVGIAEEFERSVQMLAQTFEWTVPSAAPRLNMSPAELDQRDVLNDASRNILEQATRLDARLYEVARGIFNRRCQGLVATT